MPRSASRRTALFAGLALGLALAAPIARAAQADPAAVKIDAFDKALIETMKAGPSLGAQGRYRKLLPVVEATFDLPLMTRVAVGARQQSFPLMLRQPVNLVLYLDARLIDPNVQTRGPDKIVQTRLIPAHDAPVSLAYRMRQSGGDWKVIDVFYGAISQLTTRRSDFAAPLAAGGAKGLLAHLDAVSDNLLK